MNKVISGPMVRRVSKEESYIWLVLSGDFTKTNVTESNFTGTAEVDNKIVSSASSIESIQLSKSIQVVMLKITSAHGGWPESKPIFYNIQYNNQSIFSKNYNYFDGPLPIYEAFFELPFFKYEIQHKQILHGSCRKPHGAVYKENSLDKPIVSQDVLAAFDRRIQDGIIVDKLPTLLFLTGDQIYGDDVDPSLAQFIYNESQKYFPEESFHNGEHISLNNISYEKRSAFLTKDEKFTSDHTDHHLIGFREYFMMYMTVWGGIETSLNSPVISEEFEEKEVLAQHKKVERFLAESWRVRRLLAHISTYMMFDDHEITDDWNLTKGIRDKFREKGSIGQRVVTNALAAFNLCQGWGNDPKAMNSKIFEAVKPYVENIATNNTELTAATFSKLNQSYTFLTPTLPPAIVVDTRTQRAFKDGNPNQPILVNNAELDNIKNKFLSISGNNIDNLIVVSPAPIYGFSLLEKTTFGIALLSKKKATELDTESWIGDKEQMDAFIGTITSSLLNLKNCYIFSGDVHYGFVRKEVLDKKEITFWQLTSSSISNAPKGGLQSVIEFLHKKSKWLETTWIPFIKKNNNYLLANKSDKDFLSLDINLGLFKLEGESHRSFTLLRPKPSGAWDDWVYDLNNPNILE